MASIQALSAVKINDVDVPLTDWLRTLKARRQVLPLLNRAAVDAFLLAQARAAGLTVSDGELQTAADTFRRRHGLDSAAHTQAWLDRHQLTVNEFEQTLQSDLLVAKFREHVTRDQVEKHFAAHAESYAQIRLRELVAPREDLARELLMQMQEGRSEFADLARQHSLAPTSSRGGSLGLLYRRQMKPTVAAEVFAATPGKVVGPMADPRGFVLLLVEEVIAARLDAATAASIQAELFDAWLQKNLAGARLSYPILAALQ